MRDTSIYKDLNQFSPTKRPFSTDARAVYQSIMNVIRVAFSSIPFTQWGYDLEEELFELYNNDDAQGLLLRLTSAIQDSERRVEFDMSQSNTVFLDTENSLRIMLVFNIEGIPDEKFEIDEVVNF